MHSTAFIALGANLGNPLEQCQKALQEIKKIPHTQYIACSSFYKTEPLVPKGDNPQIVAWYINAVCQIQTELKPLDLLKSLRSIEEKMGRHRLKKWESRLIDLDLLAYDNEVMQTKDLILPHPEIQNRSFVLEPLSEIEPHWTHPVSNQSVSEMIRALKNPLRIEKISGM